MDRLFSKFQLSDIKVGEHSAFPPDAEHDDTSPQQQPSAPQHQEGTRVVTTTEEPVGSAPEPTVAATDTPTRVYRPGYGHGAPEQRGEILKVSSRSRPSAVAGAIAGVVREHGRAEVQAIGAGAANQAIKAVAIARDYLRETGIEAICLPSLVDLQIDDADRTAIRLVVETR